MLRDSASGLVKKYSGCYFWTGFGVRAVGIWAAFRPHIPTVGIPKPVQQWSPEDEKFKRKHYGVAL